MGFSTLQMQLLNRPPDHRRIRSRTAHGRELTYIEGWYAISQANRIFGFDGWNRETVESRCVLTRENRGNGSFLAVYVAKVRITVKARGTLVVREGHGSGEGHGASPGEVHDMALKAAETDATKRALATFGKPFGLELYRDRHRLTAPARTLPSAPGPALSPALPAAAAVSAPTQVRADAHAAAVAPGLHPDDTTPIPRPSRYYGRRLDPVSRERAQAQRRLQGSPPSAMPSIVPTLQNPVPAKADATFNSNAEAKAETGFEARPGTRIDKSLLTIAEPRRLRDKGHLRFVAAQPCLVCGRQPCDPHHLRFAQPRALGLKVSDEFTVPLCRGHHRQLHQAGDEVAWWEKAKIYPMMVAKGLWEESRLQRYHVPPAQPSATAGDVESRTNLDKLPSKAE